MPSTMNMESTCMLPRYATRNASLYMNIDTGSDMRISNIPRDAMNTLPVLMLMYAHTDRIDANAHARS